MTKRLSIKKNIESNREVIKKLLQNTNKQRKFFLGWTKAEMSKENDILLQCPEYEKEYRILQDVLKNSSAAWNYIVKNTKSTKKIDYLDVKKIHSILATNLDTPGGQYRISNSYIALGKEVPNFEILPYRIYDMHKHLDDERCPILNRAIDIHYDIIISQLFNDLNKRTGRFTMNWFLINNGYTPIIFNKTDDNKEYITALRERSEDNYKHYADYMYYCMQRTQQDIINMLKHSR